MIQLPYLNMVYNRTSEGGVVEYTCRDCHRTITYLIPHDGVAELHAQVQWMATSCEKHGCRFSELAKDPHLITQTLAREIVELERAARKREPVQLSLALDVPVEKN
jgi:hypothetical protein